MLRSILSSRGALLMVVYPFNINTDNKQFDKTVKPVASSALTDELGWDRVKKIFRSDENGMLTKELRSIINVSVTGFMTGLVIGGITESKHTVNDFISSNEATRFTNHFEAKRQLQREVFLRFFGKGIKMARKLGTFCLLFSTIATCTTAYRGKLRIENYILGGSTTGLLTRMNLGLRGSLVGAGVGGTLGGIYGSLTMVLLYLTGTTMDEIMQVQSDWINSRNEAIDEKVKAYMASRENSEIKDLFEKNRQMSIEEQNYKETKKNLEDSTKEGSPNT